MPRVINSPPKPTPTPAPIAPFWATNDGNLVRLYHGNVTDVLARLPEKSVHMVVTSPPYWGLRDYGTAQIDPTTGDPNCEHDFGRGNQDHKSKPVHGAGHKSPFRGTASGGSSYLEQGAMTSMVCRKCGAKRIDGQLGSEPSPDCKTDGQAQCGRCHVCNIVAVFRGVYRVLRDDGTIWVNYGDSYGGYSESRSKETASDGVKGVDGNFARLVGRNSSDGTTTSPGVKSGLKSGNLVGIPWRVALALQADGWVLRQDIIWHKPAPMPESVRNRCTKAHEYVFLLAKSAKYFYDAEAIKEKQKGEYTSASFLPDSEKDLADETGSAATRASRANGSHDPIISGSNKRSVWKFPSDLENEFHDFLEWRRTNSDKSDVWTLSSRGYEGAHFATFPPKLIEPMIKAGTSEKGCCAECGAPWKRVVEPKGPAGGRQHERRGGEDNPYDLKDQSGLAEGGAGANWEFKTVGWEPTCECEADVVPCTVLDPFIGSGTTCAVSVELGRRSVGIDLSEKYLRNNAIPRIRGKILSIPDLAHTVVERKPVVIGKSIVKQLPATAGEGKGEMDDDYDSSSYCPECGERMQSDSDGDGVMTMSYEFCENCGVKDPGEPVRITEELIAFGRREGILPN